MAVESIELTVALVPDIDDLRMPWEARQKVRLAALPSTTLGGVATLAARSLLPDVEVGDRFVDDLTYTAFRRDKRLDLPISDLLRTVTVVQPGQPFRVVRWQDVTLSEVLATADALALPGWPTHQYLVHPVGFGDFTGGDWAQVADFLDQAWGFIAGIPESEGWWASLGKAADVAGTGAATTWVAQQIRKLKRRFAASTATVDVAAGVLDARQLSPSELHRILTARTWSSEELVDLLGLPAAVAEELAQTVGLERRQKTQRWQLPEYPEVATSVLHRAFHLGDGAKPDMGDVPPMVAQVLNQESPEGAFSISALALTDETGELPSREDLVDTQLRDALATLTTAAPPSRHSVAPEPSRSPTKNPDRVEYWEGPEAVEDRRQTAYLVDVVQRLRTHRNEDPLAAVRWRLWSMASAQARGSWRKEAGPLSPERIRRTLESHFLHECSIRPEQLEDCRSEEELRGLIFDDLTAVLDVAVAACGRAQWTAWVQEMIDQSLVTLISQLQQEEVDFEHLALHRWGLRFEHFLRRLENQHGYRVTRYALTVRPETQSALAVATAAEPLNHFLVDPSSRMIVRASAPRSLPGDHVLP